MVQEVAIRLLSNLSQSHKQDVPDSESHDEMMDNGIATHAVYGIYGIHTYCIVAVMHL